jgi:hypothetical protein
VVLALSTALASPTALLEGCWQTSDASHREVWLPAMGAVQVGVAVGGSPEQPFYEYLRIEPVDGVLTYIAAPKGQAVTAFPMVTSSATRVVFENPTHDFPQRIAYTVTKLGLSVTVDARDGDSRRGFTLDLKACADGADDPSKARGWRRRSRLR